jgi:hypothetical protein
MPRTEREQVEYCRSFMRQWCKAGPESVFKVVEGRKRPTLVVEDGSEVVVVGRDWLEANAVPAEYLSDGGPA